MSEARDMLDRLLQTGSCVISTASKDGNPECAAMLFVADNGDILLYTFSDSRKYANLKGNPRMSVCLHDSPDYAQMDGTVEILAGDEAGKAKKKLAAKHGESEYFGDERSRFLQFTPKWIRVRLSSEYPPEYEVLKG